MEKREKRKEEKREKKEKRAEHEQVCFCDEEVDLLLRREGCNRLTCYHDVIPCMLYMYDM